MLFAQKLLAPGPQLKHSGNVNPVLDTRPPVEPAIYLEGIISFFYSEKPERDGEKRTRDLSSGIYLERLFSWAPLGLKPRSPRMDSINSTISLLVEEPFMMKWLAPNL